MIRAHRVSATAQDDASIVTGWNISPDIPYILRLLPGTASCGVLLYDEGNMLVATGAALVGADQPCVLLPQTGQTVGMVDAELGWHLLVTTTGTESQREIRIAPTVDLPDEIHPIYADDDMALARATAAIDDAAHYRDDVTVSCPLGLGVGLGAVVSIPVDGVAVVGQVESITWTATPDGVTEHAVIRRHVAIAPEPYVEPVPVVPPTVADDTGATDAATTTSGNVLTNDSAGLSVVAVNGLSGNVGTAVEGNNGGTFTIAADGAWTFDPDGDFAALTGSETADTSVTYYASDGYGEAMATLTVTVQSGGNITDEYWDNVSCLIQTCDGSICDVKGSSITLLGSPSVQGVEIIFDGVDDGIAVSSGTPVNLPAGAWTIDFFIRADALPASQDGIIVCNGSSALYSSYSIEITTDLAISAYTCGSASSKTTRTIITSAVNTIIVHQNHHIEFSKDATNTLRLFIDGNIADTSTSTATPYAGGTLNIGYNTLWAARNFCGMISPVRITAGVCRHVLAFTPPDAPFPTE